MRRFLSIGLAVAVMFGLGLALTPLLAVHASVPQQRGEESTCIPEQNKVAYPNVLLLGEETTVTLTVKAICAAEAFPLHIVLVLDSSGSMAGEKNAQLKKAVKTMIKGLDLPGHPQIEMGIVKFASVANTLCQLTNDGGRLGSCANKVDANGGTAIDAGIKEGLKVLTRGRPRGADDGAIREVMVVLSDGGNNAGCGPVLQAAGQAKGQKVLLMTVCVGSDCDAACMRQAASSPRYFFQVDDAGAIVQAFQKIVEEVLKINLKRLTITDLVPANMQYIDGSADPEPGKGDAVSGLVWIQNYVPKDGFTITYRLRPLETGYHPTNVSALGELLDSQSRSKDFEFPVPYVTILQPFPMATPSEPPPTPTLTPTPVIPPPTETPVIPTLPPPTVTPTRQPRPIYLPILLKEFCEVQYQFADVVLVMDISTSMDRKTSAGRTKLVAALEAGKQFVTTMDLTPDDKGRNSQVAVVGFNKKAWTSIQLTNNEPAIMKALDDLKSKRDQGTRLDLGFEQGTGTVLGVGHRPENTPVMIFLTDGLPNQVPFEPGSSQEATVLAKAALAKSQGVVIYTIGLGTDTDINATLLAQCATVQENFFHEVSAEDLTKVYNTIAYSFGCSDARHNWSEPWR
jgi:Mg-chelatase subunit ChlD